MIRVTNKTDHPIKFSTGHCVPAKGFLVITLAVADRVLFEPYPMMKLKAGDIVAEVEPADKKQKTEKAKSVYSEPVEELEAGELPDSGFTSLD